MEPHEWRLWERLIDERGIVIDRPRREAHPLYPDMIYPCDYGHIPGTTAADAHRIDVFVGPVQAGLVGLIALTHQPSGIAGKPTRADYEAVPRVVCSDPESATVGLTETQARERGIDVVTARVELADSIARPWTNEKDPRGELQLVADRVAGTLVGAWAVAPLAAEWIHYAVLAIKTRTPLAVLRDTVAQFPTFSEAYLSAVEALEV